ncbi:hypothetical protein [Chryseosolibacter indicus]|uniref:Uncharacterized protein n=1 Tax=Chryseosolibacter indicus TaxID=2782351 RepID=A0ABS5VWS3_9BACT|nr:hypothetical protein [Chryseosolibacter indicus]MBT1705184.1 hypothetical protein [Chryseosolibacter indicus]
MGLFSTTLHVYKKEQADILESLKSLLIGRNLKFFNRINVTSDTFQQVLQLDVYSKSGVFYLVSEKFHRWTTIIELNVNVDEPFYLYELSNELSAKVKTYTLSFHLHDDDVLYYNLDHNGKSLDGYNSNVQYFLNDPLPRKEVMEQRHDVQRFSGILPEQKNIKELSNILDRGYWQAFDNNDLDEDGTPNDDKYEVIEEDRLKELGQYLEIYTADNFPYANWYKDIITLDLSKFYLLRADK